MTNNLVSTKETDYLDEDKPIRGQNFALLSFISPEDVLINKEVYYFNCFLEQFGKDMKTLLEGILAKYPESKELIESVKTNHSYIFDKNELNEQYNFFKSVNGSDIESNFHRDNNFITAYSYISTYMCYAFCFFTTSRELCIVRSKYFAVFYPRKKK